MPRLALASLLCGALLALADGTRPFNVEVRQMRGVEDGTYSAAEIEANGEKFTLVVPRGWRVAANPQPNSLSLSSRPGETPVTIVFSAQDAQSVLSSADTLRQGVVPFLPDANLLEEYPAYSGYGPGRGLDLAFVLQGSRMKARVAVIPLRHGYVSFTLIGSAEDWAPVQQSFATVLASFRLAPPETEVARHRAEAWPRREPGTKAEVRLAAPVRVMEELPAETAAEPEPPPPSEPPPAPGHQGSAIAILGLVLVILVARKYSPSFAGFIPTHLNPWLLDAPLRRKRAGNILATASVLPAVAAEAASPSPGQVSGLPGPRPSLLERLQEEAEAAAQLKDETLARLQEQLREMRNVAKDIAGAASEEDRQETLQELRRQTAAFNGQASGPDFRPAWQLATALGDLLDQLIEKSGHVTPPTLRTVANALDLLGDLCLPGVRPDLATQPPLRLLVADDDTIFRHAMTFALKKAFHLKPDLAEDGEVALAKATEHPYDVIFLDVQMPRLEGYEVCSRIRRTTCNSQTPVVYITLRSDLHSRAQSALSGGNDLMGKPFLMAEIAVKTLAFALRKRLDPAFVAAQPAPATRVLTALPAESAPAMAGSASPLIAPAAPVGADLPAPLPVSDPSQEFRVHLPAQMAQMRALLEELEPGQDEASRAATLRSLHGIVHALVAGTNSAELRPVLQLGSALAALLHSLVQKPGEATLSIRQTLVTAVELLDELCVCGVRPDLATDPPVQALAVDDDPIARRAISGLLQKVFPKPDLSESGDAALPLIRSKPYDIIFLDVQMPGVDGFELCSLVRASRLNRATPVVFVTGTTDFTASAKATLSGGNELIAKPFSVLELTVKALTFVLRGRLEKESRGARAAVAASLPAAPALGLDLPEAEELNREESQVESLTPV